MNSPENQIELEACLAEFPSLQEIESELNERLGAAHAELLPMRSRELLALIDGFESELNEVRQHWSEWLDRLGRIDSSQADMFRPVKMKGLDQTALFYWQTKAKAYLLLGRREEAASSYEKGFTLLDEADEMSAASLHYDLAMLKLGEGDFETAEERCRTALTIYQRIADDAPTRTDSTAESGRQAIGGIAAQSAISALDSLAHIAQLRGDRVGFLAMRSKALDTAQAWKLVTQQRNLLLDLHRWKQGWDIDESTFVLPDTLLDAQGNRVESLDGYLKDQLERMSASVERGDAGERADLHLFKAEILRLRESVRGVRSELNEAGKIVKEHPELIFQRWKWLNALFEHQCDQDDVAASSLTVQKILALALETGLPDYLQQAAVACCELERAPGIVPESTAETERMVDDAVVSLREADGFEALAQTLSSRAFYRLTRNDIDGAMADAEEMERVSLTPTMRMQALASRAAVYVAAGETEKALAESMRVIELEKAAGLDEPGSPGYRDLLHRAGSIRESAAFLSAELGRPDEAFLLAEEAKTILLRYQLAGTEGLRSDDLTSIPRLEYDEAMRRRLTAESSAFLVFCVAMTRTLVLLIDPRASRPASFFVEASEKELAEASLADAVWPTPGKSSERFLEHLDKISRKLLDPIGDELRAVMDRYETLYIVPDSRLYLVPFAALNIDGIPLVEHPTCSIAVVPSVALQQWCRSRRPDTGDLDVLAVGVGTARDAGRDVSFARQAERIVADLPVSKPVTLLVEKEGEPVTPDRFWELAPNHSIVHISSHGAEEKGRKTERNALASLRLFFSDGTILTAADVFDHADELSAHLLFLNACMSGRFRLRDGVVFGGFWQAFLRAGAATVIATLARVHPDEAEELARAFYRVLIEEKTTKARALQRAQQQLKRNRPDSDGWSRYVLIGDGGRGSIAASPQ